MGVATAGVPIGGIVHPILLNHLLYEGHEMGEHYPRHVFRRAALASAGLVAGLQLLAVLSLRVAVQEDETKKSVDVNEKHFKVTYVHRFIHFGRLVKEYAHDIPYALVVMGQVQGLYFRITAILRDVAHAGWFFWRSCFSSLSSTSSSSQYNTVSSRHLLSTQ